MTTLADRILTQRTFTAAQRKALATKGWALPDGSYPIETVADLKSAAILTRSGHGDVAAAKKLIAKRAKELGVPNPLAAKPVQQDGGAFDGSSCPECGQAMVKAGQKSPEPSPSTKKRTMADGTTVETSMAPRKLTQRAVVQVDAMKRVMTAVVQAPNMPHLLNVGDELVIVEYTPDAVKQAAWDFLRDGLQNAVGIDHAEVTQEGIIAPDGDIATVVESYTAPVCFDVRNRHISQGSWIQSYQFNSEEVWDSVLAGLRNAPSLTAPLSSVEFEEVS